VNDRGATSSGRPGPRRPRRRRLRRFGGGLAALLALTLVALKPLPGCSGTGPRSVDLLDPPAKTEEERRAARTDAESSRERFEATGDTTALVWALRMYQRAGDRIGAARATADLAIEWKDRAKAYARLGVVHAEAAIAEDPQDPAAHYYFAANLGLLLGAESLPSLGRVPEIARAAERSHELDPRLEHGAAAHLLGMLYLRAPAWPVSIGDIDEAETWLARALAAAPDWPQHYLALAELRAEQDRPEEARQALEKVLALPVPPEKRYRGEKWRAQARERLAALGQASR